MPVKFDPPLDIPHDEEFEWVNDWASAGSSRTAGAAATDGVANAATVALDALHDPLLSDGAAEPEPETPDLFAAPAEEPSASSAPEHASAADASEHSVDAAMAEDSVSSAPRDVEPASDLASVSETIAPAHASEQPAAAEPVASADATESAPATETLPPQAIAPPQEPTPPVSSGAHRLAGLYMSMRGGQLTRWNTFLKRGVDKENAGKEDVEREAARETVTPSAGARAAAPETPPAAAASFGESASLPVAAPETPADMNAPSAAPAEEPAAQPVDAPIAEPVAEAPVVEVTAPEAAVEPVLAAARGEEIAAHGDNVAPPAASPAEAEVVEMPEVVETPEVVAPVQVEDAPALAPDQLERDIAEILEVQEALFAEPPPSLALARARRGLRLAWARMFR